MQACRATVNQHVTNTKAKIKKSKNKNSAVSFDQDFLNSINADVSKPLSSRLAFLLAEISIAPDKCKLPITILHDSGCAHSILSYSAFKQFPNSHQKRLRQATNLRVESFDGIQSPIVGIIDIYLHFAGANGVYSTYRHPVIVHKSTTHDLML